MKRFTFVDDAGRAQMLPEAVIDGTAAERLRRLEDFLAYMQKRRDEIPAELEALRAQNAVKTYRFRELMTEQMTNRMIWDLLGMLQVKEPI